MTEAQVASRLRRLRADSGAWLGQDEHWSLAGAQSKFTVRETPNGWAIPHGTEPSTHIVKPGISNLPGQALTEHVSMQTARSLGLVVADTAYREFEDQPAIVVRRFDRRERRGSLVRVHQEDFCQVLGLDPSRKYEADKGPGVQKIVDVLRATTDDNSAERFAQAVIVNHLLGALDAHAKNYSVLLVGASVQLAPLYDLASGLAATRDGELRFPRGAMSIGGARAFGEVEARHWARFANVCGLPTDQVRAWVTGYASTVVDAMRDTIKAVPATAQNVEVLDRTVLPKVALLARRTLAGLDTPTGGRVRSTGAASREVAAAGRPPDPTTPPVRSPS